MSDFIHSKLSSSIKLTLNEMSIPPGSRILVGLSGGIDSMVLTHVLHQLEFKVTAAHVNFQLRGNESDEDAHFVKKWCAENNIEILQHTIDTVQYSEIHKLNIQSAAREIRYNWWEELMQQGNYDYVATGHHKDDNVETFFINLFRGTGVKGLAGIPPKRGYFIRPLIKVSRKEIEEYAHSNNIPFRTDRTNESDKYLRNHIRHNMIPLLREYADDPDNMLNHTLPRIRLEWEAWEHAFKNWQTKNITQEGEQFFLHATEAEHPFLLRWLEERGFPWPLVYDYVKSVSPEKGKQLSYNEINLSRTKDGFCFEKISRLQPVEIYGEGTFNLNPGQFSIELVSADQYSPGIDRSIEYITKDAIHWPLTIRSALPGDYFHPIGMNGQRKKLQDFLVDLKLDSFEKRNIRLLTSGETVIWVLGIRLDERAKLTGREDEIYKLMFRKKEY